MDKKEADALYYSIAGALTATVSGALGTIRDAVDNAIDPPPVKPEAPKLEWTVHLVGDGCAVVRCNGFPITKEILVAVAVDIANALNAAKAMVKVCERAAAYYECGLENEATAALAKMVFGPDGTRCDTGGADD